MENDILTTLLQSPQSSFYGVLPPTASLEDIDELGRESSDVIKSQNSLHEKGKSENLSFNRPLMASSSGEYSRDRSQTTATSNTFTPSFMETLDERAFSRYDI